MAIILDIGTEWFSNSESPCHPNASYQVAAQSIAVAAILDIRTERFEQFWISVSLWCRISRCGHLVYRNRRILAILNLHVATMPPTKFQLNPTWFWTRCHKSATLTTVDGQTDDWWTTDNRQWHKLAWSKTPGELIKTLNRAKHVKSLHLCFLWGLLAWKVNP